MDPDVSDVIRTQPAMLAFLALFFLAGCCSSRQEILKNWTCVCWTVAFHTLVLPLISMLFVNLFVISDLEKQAVLVTMVSPASLAVLPFAMVTGGDLTIATLLLVVNYIVANVTLPVWLMYCFHTHHPYSLLPTETILIDVSLCVLLFLIGLWISSQYPDLAQRFRNVTKPISWACLILGLVINTAVNIRSLLLTEWTPIIVCLLWSASTMDFIDMGLPLFVGYDPARRKPLLFFLTVKSYIIPSYIIRSGMSLGQAGPAYRSSLITALLSYQVALLVAVGGSFKCIADKFEQRIEIIVVKSLTVQEETPKDTHRLAEAEQKVIV